VKLSQRKLPQKSDSRSRRSEQAIVRMKARGAGVDAVAGADVAAADSIGKTGPQQRRPKLRSQKRRAPKRLRSVSMSP
jgi:hypothetical protein